MFEHFGHHDGVEALVMKANRGGEIHFGAGNLCLSSDLQRWLIKIHSDPAENANELDHHATSTPNIDADIFFAVATALQVSSEKGGLYLLMLFAAAAVAGFSAALSLVILLIKLLNEPATPARVV